MIRTNALVLAATHFGSLLAPSPAIARGVHSANAADGGGTMMKHSRRAIGILVVSLLIPLSSAGQMMSDPAGHGGDGATISIGMHLLGVEKDGDSASGRAQVGFAATWFDLRVPLSFNGGRTTIGNEIFWRHLDKEYMAWAVVPAEEELIVHSNSYRYTVTAAHILDSGVTLAAQISPEVKSNLDLQVDGSRTLVTGSAHATRQLTETTMLGLGAHYGRTFGRPHLHPAVAFRWASARGFVVEGFLPERAGVRFLPYQFLELGVEAEIDGDEFVGNSEVYGVDDARVRFWNATVGATARVHLTSSANLFVAAGTTARRSMEVVHPDGARDVIDPPGAAYVRAGLSLGLR